MTPTQACVVCLCCHRIHPIRETDARAFALHVSNELGGLTSMYQLLRKADTLRIYDAISLRFLTDLRKFETDETRQIELDVQIDEMSLAVRMRAMTENSLELGTQYVLTTPSLISAIASDSACMDLCVLVAQQIERGASVKKLTRMLQDCYNEASSIRPPVVDTDAFARRRYRLANEHKIRETLKKGPPKDAHAARAWHNAERMASIFLSP